MIAEVSKVSVVGEKIVIVEADWMSSGRLFQSRGPTVGNERSPTVTSEGQSSRSLEVDDTEVDSPTIVLPPVGEQRFVTTRSCAGCVGVVRASKQREY